MGILHAKGGNVRYTLELEMHNQHETELPVEKLGAIFVETRSGYPKVASIIQQILNQRKEGNIIAAHPSKIKNIIDRAQRSGTEIWFGDVDSTKLERLGHDALHLSPLIASGVAGYGLTRKITRRKALQTLGTIAGIALAPRLSWPASKLQEKGNADKRKIWRRLGSIVGAVDPLSTPRDWIMAHKIMELARRTGHKHIGVLVGSGHVRIGDLLEQVQPLTEEVKQNIQNHDQDALNMYRCIYDKNKKRWRVEPHWL